MTREEQDQLRRDYRERAKQLVGPGEVLDGTKFTVSDHAHVHVMEDGAFVEVVMWVPKEAL